MPGKTWQFIAGHESTLPDSAVSYPPHLPAMLTGCASNFLSQQALCPPLAGPHVRQAHDPTF